MKQSTKKIVIISAALVLVLLAVGLLILRPWASTQPVDPVQPVSEITGVEDASSVGDPANAQELSPVAGESTVDTGEGSTASDSETDLSEDQGLVITDEYVIELEENEAVGGF